MIASTARTNAYAQALRQTVKPGCVVLDIGTGTGIWALMAVSFGARAVYAIEPGDVIEVARETAEANGCGAKIQFIQDLSTRVNLPEPADVIVSDIRGVLPPFGQNLVALVDARRRLLAPDGVLIPVRDSMWAALVNHPELHATYTAPWDKSLHGYDMQKIRHRAVNSWKKEYLPAENLLTEPQCWAVLDYSTLEDYDLNGSATWTVASDGVAHGIVLWFDSTLAQGIEFSNAPGTKLIYGQAFFPWPEAVALKAGDTIALKLQAKLVEDYVWSWDTAVFRDGRREMQFRQSTFYGDILSPARLRKGTLNYRPTLTEEGEIDRFILTRMDGLTAIEAIGAELEDRFPERFKNCHEARSRVVGISHRYSR